MARTEIFRHLARTLRVAFACEEVGISTSEAMERAAAAEERNARLRMTRRQFLALGGASAVALSRPQLLTAFSVLDVGIVGAGFAGLVCADRLAQKGITATLYEAADRVGGRCRSLRGFFPGQVAELGGEFIDNLHKTVLGYAQAFNLVREDVSKVPGEVFYFFSGQRIPEEVVVDEFRAFVPAMRTDLRHLSGAPTADTHNNADVELDRTSLLEYLETRGAGPVAKAAIIAAYIAEYGLAPEKQSCLNFLLFIHADRRSKFTPFGVFSDERWHVLEGNDRIVEGIAARLPRPVEFGMRLLRVVRRADGRIELTFALDRRTVTRAHDAVVLAIPFTVLREVDLDPTLRLPGSKLEAIDLLGYGTNAKMMVGFSGRPWLDLESDGTSYSDLPNHQTTWETNPALATAGRAILTDYSSADRGASLEPKRVQLEALRFLQDLDFVYPGAFAQATRRDGNLLVHLEHWPSNPLVQGSYTCYLPGQFTTIAGNEGKPIDNLFFAGEHTNSFYEWQGFMEGAALSGIAAADAIGKLARVSA